MKKIIIGLLIVAAAIALVACGQNKNAAFEYEYNGKKYTVYTDENVVSDGTYSYRYSWHYDSYTGIAGNDNTIIVIYPDGSTWKFSYDSSLGPGSYIAGTYSDVTAPFRYVSGKTLFTVITKAEDSTGFTFDYKIGICICGIILFALPIAAPNLCWRLLGRKKKRYVEPTENQVTAMRLIASAVLMIVVVIIISL